MPEYPLANLLAQKITLGEVEIAKDEHGDGNKKVKTPGMVTLPDLVLEKLVPEDLPDRFFYDWMRLCQNTTTGDSALASAVKKSFIIKLIGSGGVTVKAWQIVGAWVDKLDPGDIGDTEEGNMIESVTMSIDDRYRII